MNTPRSKISRAELLRALALGNGNPVLENQLAALLDYALTRKADSKPRVDRTEVVGAIDQTSEIIDLTPAPSAVTSPQAPLQAQFMAITACERLDPSEQATTSPTSSTNEPLHIKDCKPRFAGSAPFVPLVRSTRLWPALRQSLAALHPGSVDLRRLIAEIARGEPLLRLPRLTRRHWGGELLVILDNSERLQPYCADYADLLREIVMRRGTDGMKIHIVGGAPDGTSAESALDTATTIRILGKNISVHYSDGTLPLPATGAQVLILSDLGFIAGHRAIAAQWQTFVQTLRHSSAVPVAWVPCSAQQVSAATAQVAQVYCLDTSAPLRPQAGRVHTAEQYAAARQRLDELRELLLARLACCIRVEVELLRAMRQTFADTADEPALEGVVWSHRPVVRSSEVSRPLAPAHQMAYRKAFARLPPEEQRTILHCMTHWHGWQGHSTEVFETLIWGSHAAPAAKTDTKERETVASAQQWLAKFRKTMEQSLATDSDLRNFAGDLLARNVNDETFLTAHSQTLAQMWALSGWQTVPNGLLAEDVERAKTGKLQIPATMYQLLHIGTELMLWPSDLPVPQRAVSRLGLPLRASGLLIGTASHQHQWIDLHGQCVPLSVGRQIPEPLQFIVQGHRYEIGQINRPIWATECGRDRYGLYAEFTIKTRHGQATQRLRWIEPGSFRMGSPDNEPERFNNEGPQHAVTLTHGFWLADTACTQALWQAVTGGNPSRFEDDPQNPVERVSWNDVQKFLRALEGLLPGIEASLPSEAQWEYACRAGTETAYHFGNDITPERANYAGNAVKTVPVKSLPANDWGLYEMHGNVWEWCADGLRTYDEAPQQDPEGPAGSARRAVRGGSWIPRAGIARSAYRDARDPGVAGGILGNPGFRLCLRSSGQVRPGGPSGARRPEGDLPPAPARDAPGASRAQRATDFFSRPGKSGGKRKK